MENWKILIKNVENLIENEKKISETQTMVSLVLKLFKNLKWDIFDVENIKFEEKTENKKRADIAFYSNEQKIIVEVKRFQTELNFGHFEQLMNYVNNFGNCKYGILTNGNDYWIGDNSDGSKANKDKRIYHFSVEKLTDFNVEILKTFEYGFKNLKKIFKIIQFQNLDIELNNKKENLVLSEIKEEKETEVLKKEKPKSNEQSKYTENDHLDKANEKFKNLYQKLKKNILDLDENIEIHFLSGYISFKIKKHSFFNIIIKKKFFKIHFGNKKMKLHDEQNICRDILNVRTLGVGDFQFHIKDENNFDYQLDLIKQSFVFIKNKYS